MSGAAATLRELGRHSAALLFAVGVGPAAAQGERPPALPTRDVAVTYRVVGAPSWVEMRVSWLASERRRRIDWPGGARATVVDHGRPGGGFMVFDAARLVRPLPADLEPGLGTLGDAWGSVRFVRAGAASYAGQPCGVWRHHDEYATVEACVTEDGVMLREVIATQAGQTGGLEALEIVYGPQDPARFRWPDGYRVARPSAAAPPATVPSGR